jgi:hypothetical protein
LYEPVAGPKSNETIERRAAMKKTIFAVSLSVITTFAATQVLAEQSCDGYDEGNQSLQVCRLTDVHQEAPVVVARSERLSSGSNARESIDCFYKANQSLQVCQLTDIHQEAPVVVARSERLSSGSSADDSANCL